MHERSSAKLLLLLLLLLLLCACARLLLLLPPPSVAEAAAVLRAPPTCWQRIEEYWKPNWRVSCSKASFVSCTASRIPYGS